ncbi:MAG: hypothetical protein LBG91_05105 [Treponema sp.]|nr:hypothetical protein [Treponema sp.]
MDKRIYICAAVVFLFALLGLLAYSQLEIYPRKTFAPPVQEALSNNYFAMEKWLNETGHPVRIEKQYSPAKIAATHERVVFVRSSACTWEDAGEVILPWIERGGCLVISIDYDDHNPDSALVEFLAGFGIGIDEIYEHCEEETIPYFCWDIYFPIEDAVDYGTDVFTIDDENGFARLAEVPKGEGVLTVISKPWFMYNSNLGREINARLSWDLTGARANGNNTGVLFVHERYVSNSLFGKIMERGNLVPVIISALLVIFLGFWSVIPVFGTVLAEKQRTARPIRERFNAEIRFLKKYGALDYYRDVYKREMHVDNEPDKDYKYRDLINQYRSMFDGTAKF